MARRISQTFVVCVFVGMVLFVGLFVEWRTEFSVAPLSSYLFSGEQMPEIKAQAYMVMDLETRTILLEKDSESKYPIASLTKMMTALVMMNGYDQFSVTTVSPRAVGTEGWSGRLVANEQLTLHDLLFPLILESSNDAAEAIAEYGGRAAFIEKMNGEAKKLGMTQTFYKDPSGLSPQNVSSAHDLATLAEYIYRTKRHIFDISMLTKHEAPGHTWRNILTFNSIEGYIGGKNGFIPESLHTLVILLDIKVGGTTRPVVIVLLRTTDKNLDIEAIRTYIQGNVSFD